MLIISCMAADAFHQAAITQLPASALRGPEAATQSAEYLRNATASQAQLQIDLGTPTQLAWTETSTATRALDVTRTPLPTITQTLAPSSTRTASPTFPPDATVVGVTEFSPHDGSLVYLTLPDQQTFNIVDRSTSSVIKSIDLSPFYVSGYDNDLGTYAFSPEGNRVVFFGCTPGPVLKGAGCASPAANIYILNVNSGLLKLISPEVIWKRGTEWNLDDHLDWSSDGEWIVFAKKDQFNNWGVEPHTNLALMHPDGTGYHTILSGDSLAFLEPTFSPDGSHILFAWAKDQHIGQPTHLDIFIIGTDGSRPLRLVKDVPGSRIRMIFSPDGKWMYYRVGEKNYQASIECYYRNACESVTSLEVDFWPDAWYKNFYPRWAGM